MNPRERYYTSTPGQSGLSEIHAVQSWESEIGQSGSIRTILACPTEYAENILLALRSGRTNERELQEKGWRSVLGLQQQ